MKQWKFLAVSDTHLGEDSSILSYKPGRSHLYDALRNKLGDGDEFEVDELVLVGDIADRTLSSTSQIMTQTYDFMKTLFAAARIKRVVYVPGNHDHTLWTDYIKRNEFPHIVSDSPEGDLLLAKGDYEKAKDAPELMTMLFGYSEGTAEQLWVKLSDEKQVEFSFANPLYAKAVAGRTYVFTHGTHFRRDVMSSDLLQKLFDYLQVDRLIGRIEIDSAENLAGAVDLRDLERRVTPLVDSLWPSSKDQATGKSDRFWYLMTSISGKFRKHKRGTPPDHSLMSLAQLRATEHPHIRRLGSQDESIQRLRKQFLPLLLDYLEQEGLAMNPLTLVYGDTHRGGFHVHEHEGKHINLFNCGSWVAHNENDHPDCHLFAVNEANEEHLLDVTFRGVNVGTRPIVEVASLESEHKKDRVSKVTRFLLDRLF
ncbi:MAG TPA: metallophosphoesterase [Polyangiaceae bacterium]|nr:metallophosphoesterase [Polyangiaceae bacterium]